MVAHNIADAPFFAVMVRRRPFFQEDPLIMFLTLGLYVIPSYKVQVEPCFVVAALIGRAQAPGFMRNVESTMKPNVPKPIGFRRFKEPTTQTSAQLPGIDRGPQRCGAGRHRQGSRQRLLRLPILQLSTAEGAAPAVRAAQEGALQRTGPASPAAGGSNQSQHAESNPMNVCDNQRSLLAAFWSRSKWKVPSHVGTSEAFVDAHTRRRRVRALLVQEALYAPTMGERDAILEALQEQPD